MMIMDVMKLITICMFIFVLVFPVFYLTYVVIRYRKCIKQYTQQKKFYRTNYSIDKNGTKKLNGAWHK